MWTSPVVQALSGSAWLALLALILWLLLKSRAARTVDFLVSVKAVDRQLRAQGVPEIERREMFKEATRRHLDLPDQHERRTM